MPESVFLRFTAPDREDLVKLRIFESVAAEGPWTNVIEEVTGVDLGTYPDYISQYTTNLAASKTNWFSIQWEDDKGAVTEISNPVQGGTSTLVGEIIALVGERDITLDDQVVRQETEFAIETYFGSDPYLATTDSYRVKVGLARLVQARSMMSTLATASGTNSGWTAGLVSMKSGTSASTSENLIRWLLEEAANGLGLSVARVAQMAQMVIAGGLSTYNGNGTAPVLVEVE